MASIGELLEACAAQLASDTARLDAETLLAHVLGCGRSFFYAWPDRQVEPLQAERFLALARRRAQGVPVAYLIGEREFWSLSLAVAPSTLIPRPETELLVETALARLPRAGVVAADLGTGTGAIILALAKERPAWRCYGVEYQGEACRLAETNRQRHHLNTVTLVQASWADALADQSLDLLISNPPYIRPDDPHLEQGDVAYEPRTALVAKESGLADLRHLAQEGCRLLRPGGWIMLEHGADQGGEVRALLVERAYLGVSTHQDLAGLDRVTIGQRPVLGEVE